jgi:peptidoglycan/LPS O-acetylase OafA/YrhL
VAASIAFFAYVGAILLVVGTPPHWGTSELLWGVAVVVGAALGGKAVGVVRSRRRLFDELERLAQPAQPDGGGGA